MASVITGFVEWASAARERGGEGECGDRCVVIETHDGVVLAAADGLGHGDEAARAACAAVDYVSGQAASEHILSVARGCHEELRKTRGVVMSLASINGPSRLLTWLGIGNVEGLLLRADEPPTTERLLLRNGVLGNTLPALQATVLPINPGDTLVFVTDGISGDYEKWISPREDPQSMVDRVLNRCAKAHDDALVLVARFRGDGK